MDGRGQEEACLFFTLAPRQREIRPGERKELRKRDLETRSRRDKEH